MTGLQEGYIYRRSVPGKIWKEFFIFSCKAQELKDEPVVVRKDLENPGTVRFAEYIYLTGEPEDTLCTVSEKQGTG